MTVVLGKEQILHCFDTLNQKLAEHGQHGEILVCGGASMALLFDDTTVTKDIDAVILSTEMKNDISKYAAQIAEEQSLDEDWFNEAAKGYVNLTWDRKEVSKYSNLAVYSVPAEQLLAMKLSAARTDARDMEDAIKLMKHLGLQHEDEALEILEKNMPGIILTAKNEFFAREAFAEYKEREKPMEKRRLFVDMDGTLAVFTPVDTMETLYEKGYFQSLEPIKNAVAGLKLFIKENPETEVFILSSVLSDSPYALKEKQAWLTQQLPEIDTAHQIFNPCGTDKSAFVPGGITATDILLDDYTDNLLSWQNHGGTAIKFMNGINGTRGRWKGKRLEGINLSPESFSAAITGITKQLGLTEVVKEIGAEADEQKEIQTNMGSIPIEDYREIIAMQHGFDSYEEMCKEGFVIGNDDSTQEKSPDTDWAKVPVDTPTANDYHDDNSKAVPCNYALLVEDALLKMEKAPEDFKDFLGRPTAYITPGTSRNAFIKTMDEESRRSIERAIRLVEIQEGYAGTELEDRVEEAMSNRLSAIDESLHVEERLDLAGQSIVTIENEGCTYVVLAEAVSEYGNTDLLLMRGSDRHFLIAKGWDAQSQTWDHGQYFGWDKEALADAASEFAGHAYVRRCFAQSSLQEQFKTILEAEFPETIGNDTLQEDLYENFMESNQEGLFNNDLRREVVRKIEAQRQVEIEWETEWR